MVWTETTRRDHARVGLRYASDLTDGEWRLVAPLLPQRCRWGRPRVADLRAIVEALLYVAATGCQWRALPKEFPPRSTVQGYFYRWQRDHVWQRIADVLAGHARRAIGRPSAPSVGIIDSQSVATTESGGPRGLDAGKRIKGRKRHIVTDSQGHVLALRVHPANVQDCHGAVPLLLDLRRRLPALRHILADRVYRGEQLLNALAPAGPWTIEIVQRPPGTKGFQPLPRRWVVERTPSTGSGHASPGSADAAASPKISNAPSKVPPPGSSSPTSVPSSDASHDQMTFESDSQETLSLSKCRLEGPRGQPWRASRRVFAELSRSSA